MNFWLLCLLLFIACFHDLRERRIPNGLIAAGMLMAISLGLYGDGLGGGGRALTGLLLGLAVLFPFFMLHLVGAGDVKLMALVGGFVGLDGILPVALYSIIAGGLLAIIGLVWTRSSRQALQNMSRVLQTIAEGKLEESFTRPSTLVQTAHRVPYALAIATGVCFWLVAGH